MKEKKHFIKLSETSRHSLSDSKKPLHDCFSILNQTVNRRWKSTLKLYSENKKTTGFYFANYPCELGTFVLLFTTILTIFYLKF